MKKNKTKLFILALDGTPYSLLQRFFADGIMPNLASLAKTDHFKRMNSVLPPISAPAWASFMTGVQPAKHKIFGFIEREPASMEVHVPTSADIPMKTIWQHLSDAGKKVCSINVPVTYPPRPVDGITVSGFLAPSIEKAAWPRAVAEELRKLDYRIDSDTIRARTDLVAFSEELLVVLERRLNAMWHFYRQQNWDVFMLHIMETDRLHHFMWEHFENGHPRWAPFFTDLYRRIDKEIGKIIEATADSELMILSDHGFCTLEKEVFINKWLFDQGYLKFNGQGKPDSLHHIHPQSQAYSLIPGRIYINLKGREKNGNVNPGTEYEVLRNRLISELENLRDPENGRKVIKRVLRGEDAYCAEGVQPASSIMPDLIIDNARGYEFKGNLWYHSLFEKGPVVGMHTFDDAFLLIKEQKINAEVFSIVDMQSTIFQILDLAVPPAGNGISGV